MERNANASVLNELSTETARRWRSVSTKRRPGPATRARTSGPGLSQHVEHQSEPA
jgi:hypothetical protein